MPHRQALRLRDSAAIARISDHLVGFLLTASAFTLGFTKTHDSDAWTHLALGREMVRQRGFPAHEPFLFPSAALPYFNTEWLFDVVLYLAYLGAGFVGVSLLKAVVPALAFFILWKDSAPRSDSPSVGLLGVAIRAAVLFPALLTVWYRFVERPDLALMVFLSFTIYALNAYLDRGRPYLFALPVLQVIWANTHPSVVLGFVPFVAILVGGPALHVLRRRYRLELPALPTPHQLKTIGLVFVAVVCASVANPHGIRVLTEPFRLATFAWFGQYIREMQPPPFTAFPAPFILTGVLAVTTIALAKRVPIMNVLLVVPFLVLGFSARRFVFLTVVVAAPVLARDLVVMAAMLRRVWVRRAVVGIASGVAVVVITIVSLAVARVDAVADPTKIAGAGVNDRFLPEGALRYLDAAGVSGRVFNIYEWGGYLEWRDFSRRSPMIDGRAYVPSGLLEAIHFAMRDPEILERLHVRYGFEIVLVNYPGMATDPSAVVGAVLRPEWALVYWDDVAVVFLRRTRRMAPIIARDEYRYVNPGNGVPQLRAALADRSKFGPIEAEVRRNVAETGSAIGYALLGFAHLQARAYDKAIDAFGQAGRSRDAAWHGAQGLAIAHWQKGEVAQAIDYYKWLANVSEDAVFLYNVALGLVQTGNGREAVSYLQRARARDPLFLPVYPLLISVYRSLGDGQAEERVRAEQAKAVSVVQASDHLTKAEALHRQGRFNEALTEIKASLRLNSRNARALSDLGEVYLSQGLLDDAVSQQRAALDVDPTFAKAHYALARTYQKRGEPAAARTHLERFVYLEPRGYLSWKAREELSRLTR